MRADRRPSVRAGFLAVLASFLALLAAGVFGYVRRPLLPSSGVKPPAGVDPVRLERHVRRLASSLPRDWDHPEALDRVAAYIKRELEASGGRLSEQVYGVPWWDQRNRKVVKGPFRNVIAVFGPDSEERLVVGAHYDAFGPFPAADDNASGVAALLELARLLGAEPPAMRVDLAAYTMEEPPLFGTSFMGSAQHAAKLKKEGVRIRAMIALEMLGFYSDEPGSQGTPSVLFDLLYPDRGDFIGVVTDHSSRPLARPIKAAMRGFGLPVYSITAPPFVQGIDYSDHGSFWDQGYQAAMLTDTAFLRNKNYHKPTDTPETLDYRRMALATEGALQAVRALASRRSQ
ncbi:MAG: M28 family peptidase [Elusimicrobia bacterium]|nr:M28 family peptidase [Elusimicrobiota bacterium]